MLESSLDFLRCVRCESKIQLEVYKSCSEIEEGILDCEKCNLKFPIIEKIPILWDDFSHYLSSRKILGGRLYQSANDARLKNFLKNSLSKTNFSNDDRTQIEERWCKIYQKSQTKSTFYSEIRKFLDTLPKSKLVLEYGCSIGTITSNLSEMHELVFGIDRSFDAIKVAKKTQKNNLEYIVADSLSPVFGNLQFDLILALNVLDLIEPLEFIEQVSNQISSGFFVISDPYDYDRGPKSVKTPINETSLRRTLEHFAFQITPKTQNPSFIPWTLNLNPRAQLNYDVDLVICKKCSI